MLAQCYRYVERGGGYALLNPERIAPASEPLRQESFRFEDAGFALLRSPEATVVLKYGPHGGGHGHPDKLSISVHDGRKELVSDFGTSAYGAPDYTKWYRKTLAHNTVTVAGTSRRRPGNSSPSSRGPTEAWSPPGPTVLIPAWRCRAG